MDLAPKFSIPDLTTETIGIIGKRGSGKSHTGTLLVEELLQLDSQVIVIDPIGGWWGLRAGADGKSTNGFSIPIFGGLHGDIPLEERSGALLADYLVENRLSGVIDLSDFSKSAMRRFVRDFAERFYLLKNKQRDPVHVVIDECDLFVPQRVDSPEMMPLVGAINDFVLRGRQRGIGVTLISQRPARIAKDVLTQVEILIAFRLTGPQDIKAFGEWIEHNGTKEAQKEVLATLSSLERGTGWFWAPGLMSGLLKMVAFRARHTYDSSRTPDGKRIKPPKTLRDVDLGQLSEAMKATVERAKSDDPKLLKAEISRLLNETRVLKLERELKHIKADPAIDKTTLKRLEKVIERAEGLYSLEASYIKELENHRNDIAKIVDVWSNRLQPVLSGIGNLQTELQRATKTPETKPRAPKPFPSIRSEPPKKAPTQGSNGEAPKLGPGERKCMVAIAQYGDDGVTKTVLSQLTAFARSTRDKYVQKLRSAGYVIEEGERVIRTDEGVAWIGDDYEELPTGDALYVYWMKKLPNGEARILELAHDRYPTAVTKEDVGAELKFARSTRDKYIQKLGAKRVVIETTLHNEPAIKMSDVLADQE
jgi:DNA helicase HerA-like ATPase